MVKKARKVPQKLLLNHFALGFQLLDSAYDGFCKRVLWPETSRIRISANDREQLANVFVSLMEMTEEALNQGAISDEIRGILQETANEITIMARQIALYNQEKDA